jgi:tRNA (cytidine/uridine-2'-O-)-methyltransferase
MTALFHIVLFTPEIPNNTGNIGRLSVATNCLLHLIHPLGFSLEEKAVRRAGIDWWQEVKLCEYRDWQDFEDKNKNANLYFLSRFAEKSLYDISFKQNDFFIFGSESSGLPDWLKAKYPQNLYKIPMPGAGRSLNLANSVSVCVYEGIRQLGFK